MSKDKSLEEKLLAKPTHSLSDEELSKVEMSIKEERSQRSRAKTIEARKKVIINDFNDPRVQPFAEGAIYKVYNKQTKAEEVLMNGRYIEGFISSDDNKYKQFEAKSLGGSIEIDNKEIIFLKFEIN